MSSEWIVGPRSRMHPARLYCAPFAGGNSNSFRAWGPLLDRVDLFTVRAPGRESRFAEPALDDAVTIARHVTDALVLDQPYALYGHSLGATVAHEVAREIARRDLPAPAALIVSGRAAPTSPSTHAPIAQLPRDAFVDELRKLSGTPKEILDNRELMDVVIPTLRADFAAAENYVRPPGPPIDVPLFVYGGTTDEVSGPALQAWDRETTATTTVRMFEGGHFFIRDRPDEVVTALRDDLRSVLS